MPLPRHHDLTVARAESGAFLGACALLFAGSTAITVLWCTSMSHMHGMHMPGGWTMSMTWMRMPDQSWLDAAASFLGMWVVMMAAMMLPSLMPMLLRYRQVVRNDTHLAGRTVTVGAGYFFVWTGLGLLAYPPGVALATLAMQSPQVSEAVPLVAGITVFLAGILQFTRWKARRLACCRHSPTVAHAGNGPSQDHLRAAWQVGMKLGLRCAYCCGSLMLVLLVLGVMDLRAMAVVTLAITAERVMPRADRTARIVGIVGVAAGLLLIARAAVFA